MKDQIQVLMNKEMSRVEFLQHVGAGLLVAFGLSGIAKAILQQNKSTHTQTQGLEYGDSYYGGVSR